MNINATFFIQAFHFLIAYFLLKKLLFKPVVKDIIHEQSHYNDLVTSINNGHSLLKKKEELKQQQWHDVKLFFAKTMPSLQAHDYVRPTALLQPALDKNSYKSEETQKSVEDALIKRLSHVS